MDSKKYNEIVFDSILRSAFYDAVEEEIEETEKKDTPQIDISKKHKRIQRRLYDQRKKRINYIKPLWLKALQGVAACVVAFCVACSAFVFSVPTVRAHFLNGVMKPFEKYISFDFAKESDLSFESGAYSLGYIPKNFVLTSQLTDSWYEYRFENFDDDTYFEIAYYHVKRGKISVDSEHSKITEFMLGNNIAYYVVDTHSSTIRIAWRDGDYFFFLNGNLSKEQMTKIAEGVTKN